jgi:hypothetical protein
MKDILKAAVKSKTMNFGSLLVIAGLIEQNSALITQLVPDQYDGLAISLIGVVVWGLRFVTTSPLVNRGENG